MKACTICIPPQYLHYNCAFRSKMEIIRIVIEVVRLLNVVTTEECQYQEDTDENSIQLTIAIDKMSRVFISEKNKIHSFSFPFTLQAEEEHFNVLHNGADISCAICSVLAAIFHDLSDEDSLENILERYWTTVSDLDVSTTDAYLVDRLITLLCSFEPGYLRFDHDESEPIRLTRECHPINHLDINYSTSGTYKFGLDCELSAGELLDILNINKPCCFLGEMPACTTLRHVKDTK